MKKYIWPFVIWSCGALAFLLQYACRVSAGGMIDPIMLDFSIGATMAGLVGSAFYYPYIIMQLFVGRVVDKYPAHRVLIFTTIVFFFANQMFSESSSINEAIIARAIMGAMGAFTFVATMKLALIWFENRFLGVLAGLTQVSGMLGVVFGNYIVDISLIDAHWRPVIRVFSSYLSVLILIMLCIMKDKPKAENAPNDVNIYTGLLKVWKNPQSWYNALFAGLLFLPTAAFGEYWGIQYLAKTSEVLTRHDAVVAINMIFIGWAIGGIAMGWYSDHIQKRRPLLLVTPLICMVLILPVLYGHHLSAMTVNILLFSYGMFNSGLVVSYAISGEINDEDVSGVSIAFCNMLSILLGSIALPLVGIWVDHYLIKGLSEAVAYQQAVSILPLALILAFIAGYCVEETNCQRKI